MLLDDKKLLLIDDICDSGDTLAMVVENLATLLNGQAHTQMANLRTAVLWNNVAQDVFEADYVGREISRADDERWIIFPYEEWWKA
jgi:hypoxanthine phosphoribosyltransferase